MTSIRLSEKHGVNPALMQCYFCLEDMGVALMGRLKGDAEAPHRAVFDKKPCDKCEDHMKKGVILISVRNGAMEQDRDNPYRTGGWIVVTEDCIKRLFDGQAAQDVLKHRVAFVEDEAWDRVGFPRGDSLEDTGGPDD